MQNPAAVLDNKNSRIRLTNNGLPYAFQEALLATTSGSNPEHKKFVGQISTIMRVLTSKDGDLLSQFDINEGNTDDDFDSTSLKKTLIDNHENDADRGKIKTHLPLEHIFGFCKLFKKITNNLGFEITFKTSNLQKIIYTSIAEGTQINLTFNSLYLYVPFLIPSAETQLMFKESTQNTYRIFFDEWYTKRRIATDQVYQVDIGSAQSVNSPKYLICAHQTTDRADLPNQRTNISFFDHLDVRNYYIEIDGFRYRRDDVLTNYNQND